MTDKEPQLTQERTSIKSSATRINTFVKRFTLDDDIEQLTIRNDKLEELWIKYNTVQQLLENLDFDKHQNDRELFEDRYYESKSLIEKAIKSTNLEQSQIMNNSVNSVNTNLEQACPKVKLPQLNLPQFSGNYKEWRTFYDMFTSVIHENDSISNIQKLFYLKSSLKGEALQIIESVTATADNYNVAFQLLIDRYNNENYIIDAHMKALFEIPQASKDSVSGLRRLVTETKQHMRSLESLQLPTEYWDAIIIYMVAQKLDAPSRREWELQKTTETRPALVELYKFIEQRCFALEAISTTEKRSEKPKTRSVHVAARANPEEIQKCNCCNGSHFMSQCDKFLKQLIDQRVQTIKACGVCFNCLKTGHGVAQCRSRGCRKCDKKHHTLIHFDAVSDSSSRKSESSEVQPHLDQASSINALHNYGHNNQVLLSTAEVLIRDNDGVWQTGRALLDSASQSNFISTRLSKLLRSKQSNVNVPINGISQMQTNIKKSTKLEVKSRYNNFVATMDFLLLDNITNQLPTSYVNISNWILPDVPLADPRFNEPREVDLLIGAQLYFELMKPDQIKLGKGMPILQNSQYGWIVAGRLLSSRNNESVTCYLSTAEQIMSKQLTSFWEIEEISHEKHLSKQELECEEHFQNNTLRNEEGKFVVKLPFKNSEPEIGDSYDIALRRFQHLEKRLNANSLLRDHYTEFLDEYSELNHMEKVTRQDGIEELNGYYLPHHAVIKTTSLTTKMRVVFDGSARTTNGRSLNDELMVGPTIQDDLFSIITRFRQHKFVLTADIEKMYRQILMSEDDTMYQKILWRRNPAQPIETFKLKTVTYGTAPAPFLAIRCLHQLAIEEGASYPIAAEKLRSDFYVDDVLTGADTLEEARIIRDQLIEMLARGGFRLRKWSSNYEELLSTLPNVSNDPLLYLDTSKTIKTLGLHWNASQDTFMYRVTVNEDICITKRQILSQIARLFDPLGLVGPILVQAKIMMQKLWQLQADWDEPVPTPISDSWKEFMSDLSSINQLSIPRRIITDEPVEIQLHAFCDASELAYGACIYIRSTDKYNNHLSRLVCSKSKIAPLKKLTIPRLELCAAVLLAKLYKSIRRSLSITISKIYFWSDSTITLYWINTPVNLLKTFVANRVAEIHTNTEPRTWRHIRSEDNPADVISRGQSPSQILDTNLWWHGPSWMTTDESSWPESLVSVQRSFSDEIAELKPSAQTTHVSTKTFKLFDKFSTLSKLQRIVAFCLRFIDNAKRKSSVRQIGTLSVDELRRSLDVLIKLAQTEAFSREIAELQHDQQVSRKSQLSQLYPFLDSKSIIRVGGRLQNSDVPFEQKHQAILPAGHQLTKLLYKQTHLQLLHAGNQAVLSHIRERFWPINARAGIRHTIYNCMQCFKLKARQQSQLMGMLPTARVTISRPFLNTGLDYGGPVPIRVSKRASSKAYIALFVCMATKAVHLELVSSLATSEFLAALRRFVARRGKCANIYSDNGTNFKGANNELINMHNFLKQQSHQDYISNETAKDGIQWHFIPPSAPHFGGLWEAGIKTVKYHLKRVIGESVLTFEELSTLLAQIEACVNSRPLFPLSDDPTNFTYLTPSHFLIGDTLTSIPEADLTDTQVNRLTRWQLVQQKTQHFWHSWTHDYLNQLQQRTKWTRDVPNITIGKLVLIKEDNTSPLKWKLGRVEQLHPGKDGKVRVVTVKTSSGELKRPVTKICLLPMEEDVSKPRFQGGRNVGDTNRTLRNSSPS